MSTEGTRLPRMPAPRTASSRRARHIRALQRRELWLRERVAGSAGADLSYDRAEASALRWALRIISSAERDGIIAELEEMP